MRENEKAYCKCCDGNTYFRQYSDGIRSHIGTQIVAEIVHAEMEQIMKDIEPLQLSNSGSVVLGVMFLVMSLICQYGAVMQKVEK